MFVGTLFLCLDSLSSVVAIISYFSTINMIENPGIKTGLQDGYFEFRKWENKGEEILFIGMSLKK